MWNLPRAATAISPGSLAGRDFHKVNQPLDFMSVRYRSPRSGEIGWS